MPGLRSEEFGHFASDRERRWRGYLVGISAGHSECLRLLYDESAPLLLGLACRMMKNTADAEEIILDVLEQVWRSARSFDPERGSAWRWLTLLVRSRAVDRLRTAAARHNRDYVLPLAAYGDPVSHEPSPDFVTLLNQQRIHIRGAMQLLPGEQRQAVELAYFSGLTHVEIASELDVPLGTIKTRIRAGMDKLRISLARDGFAAAANSPE
jgi:RNA polymerase sigma-70 factor (ECF subfamily)